MLLLANQGAAVVLPEDSVAQGIANIVERRLPGRGFRVAEVVILNVEL